MFQKRILALITAALACAGGVAAAQNAIPPMKTSVAAGQKAVATYFTEDSVGDVQLGQLGLQKSRDASVRSLAQALVRDHTMTAGQGMRVAQTIGDDDVQWKPGDDNRLELARLSRYGGAQFDREYVKTLVDAHQTDISTATDALDFVTSPDLRRYLQQTLAVDRKHLKMAQTAQSNL